MKRTPALALLFGAVLFSPAALAFDGHGITYSPGQAELTSPVVIWQPWSAPAGTFSGGLVFEYADGGLVLNEQPAGGGPITQTELVGGLTVANLGATYALHRRVGVGAGMPVYLSQTTDGDQQGPGLGDARLFVPVGIIIPEADGTGPGLSVIPRFGVGLGDQNRYLGTEGVTFGAVATAGYGRGKLRFSANGGLLVDPRSAEGDDDSDTIERAASQVALVGGSVGYLPTDNIGLSLEAFWKPSVPSHSTVHETGPAELIGSARVGFPKNMNLVLGGASSLNTAAGAARYRVFAGITWGRRDLEGPEEELVPVVKKAETPYDLTITATDHSGEGVDADIVVTGEGERYETNTGRDGETILSLHPGSWEVTLSSPGKGTQSRDLELDEERFVPPELEAILHESDGEGSLELVLIDPESHGIDGARVSIDGDNYGTTTSGGTLRVEGVAEGDHTVSVDVDDFEDTDTFEVSTDETETLVLERPPGAVAVRVRTEDGGVVGDAQVRFFGPDVLESELIGPTGEKQVVLEEGTWTVVVSSEAFGAQEREVVVDPLRKVLQVVDVVLTETLGSAELRLDVIDPDGLPVPGARVELDGKSFGRTSNGGSFSMSGLTPGPKTLRLSGPRFVDTEPISVELVDGVRELLVTLDWKPGTLQVVTRGRGEVPVDAKVRFEGPTAMDTQSVGPDGEAFFALPPGDWVVGVSAESLGLQVREVHVEPDATSLIMISAVLREEAGDAVLALDVKDPKGNPIEGARIALDGELVGSTSTGGTLRLEGLAPGESTLEVAGALYEYKSIDPVSLESGDNGLDIVLQWLAGTVNIKARTSAGDPVDALIRAYGPAVLTPVRVGPDGERVLYLEPGGWTVVASSEIHGIEQEDVDVEPGQESLVSVAFELEVLGEGERAFVLAIQNVDGDPIGGASVKLGGADNTTPDGGTVVLEEAPAGEVDVAVSAPGYLPMSETLETVGGNQTRTLTLTFVDQPVQVTVKTDKGEPLAADVRFVGPVKVDPMEADQQGVATAELRPGEWTVVAQAPELGAGRAEFVIEPGVAPAAVEIELKDTRVEVVEGEVVILQKVQFDTGRATIKAESHNLLDEVANVLLLNPQLVRVEIQGHTDDVGTDETNLKLSQRRAQAVRDYLVDKGVKKARLVAEGYGSTKPIESNDTEAGRSANRRVQFEIVQIDESKE